MRQSLKNIVFSAIFAFFFMSAQAQNLPQTFTHTLSDGGESYTINFSRFSSRGPLFEVAVQQANGSFQSVDVGESRTYIGSVIGQPGAVAACVRRADGSIFTRMTLENGFEWIDHGGSLTIEERELTPSWPTFGLRDGGAGSTLYAADIFIDLTNRYYGTAGGTAETCMEMVDFSMTAINMLYMRDVNLMNRIGRVSIRADLTRDPYSADGGVMSDLLATLNTVDDAWVDGPDPTTDHDLATVIQSLAGGGVANVGALGAGRSANGGFTTGDFAGAARHEFGHNWGLNHFDGRGEGEPLSPEGKTINSGNGLAKMSAPEMELALSERDGVLNILTSLGTTAPNLPPRAADDRLELTDILIGEVFEVQPLANDNDANGESLSIVSYDSTTLLGASVSITSGDALRISFPSSYAAGYDYLRYQISDESGRTSSAVVHINMGAAVAFTPDPTKKYFIDAPAHNLRLGATGQDEDPFTTSIYTTGPQVEWVFVDKGNGSWHIQLAAGGSKPRLRSRNNGQSDMQATSSSGSWTYYDVTPGALVDTHFLTLPDHNASRSRLQIDSSGSVNFVAETSTGISESFRITDVANAPFTPNPNKSYFIENSSWGFRVAADGESEDPYTDSTSADGVDTRWKLTPAGDLWYVDRAAGGTLPRLRTDGSVNPDMQATSAAGVFTVYEISPSSEIAGTYYMTLPWNNQRLRVMSNGSMNFNTNSDTGENTSLSFIEVDALHEDLVTYWKMDGTSATSMIDSSGNGFNGTMSNVNRVAGGLEFNGSSSTVSIPSAVFADIDDEITIAMWIYGGAGQARSDTIFRAQKASGGRVLNIHLPWGNSQVYWDAGYDGQYDRVNKPAAVANFKDSWNHWAFTKNTISGEMKIYLNGALWHSGTSKTKSMSGISSASLGSSIGNQFYQGNIDEVMIYKTSLSASEIAGLYNSYLGASGN